MATVNLPENSVFANRSVILVDASLIKNINESIASICNALYGFVPTSEQFTAGITYDDIIANSTGNNLCAEIKRLNDSLKIDLKEAVNNNLTDENTAVTESGISYETIVSANLSGSEEETDAVNGALIVDDIIKWNSAIQKTLTDIAYTSPTTNEIVAEYIAMVGGNNNNNNNNNVISGDNTVTEEEEQEESSSE